MTTMQKMGKTSGARVNNATVEVKVRPKLDQSQKSDIRVMLSIDALLDLGIKSGDACSLCKLGDESSRREAVAWQVQGSMKKDVIQISNTFQTIFGCKTNDTLVVSSGGHIRNADVFEMIVAEGQSGDWKEWEDWFRYSIVEHTMRLEYVYPGMVLSNVTCMGEKCSFQVVSVNGLPDGVARCKKTTVPKIVRPGDELGQSLQKETSGPLAVVDISGIDHALEKLNAFLADFGQKFEFTEAQRSCAVLLHGGHGTGKTFVMERVVSTGWGKVHRVKRDAKSSTIRDVFKEAKLHQPSIIVIDNLESLVSTSHTLEDVLGEELDALVSDPHADSLPRVLVIAATIDISSIPRPLRDIKRFETDILLPVPDGSSRKAILRSLNPRLHPDVRDQILDKLGERTHAYTAKDLVLLLNKAYYIAESRKRSSDPAVINEAKYLSQEDIEQAMLQVRPTAMHDNTLQPPRVKWNEIGGQANLKEALQSAVELPLKYPELMQKLGAPTQKGVLLYGPPGCSKTLSAQAMATEVGFNFFAVKGAELLNMYVGESERAVRDIFSRARAASPSIIFFDEIESIGGKREGGGRSSGVHVLTTLLNELDGIETLEGVMVLAATNKPQDLDLALLRPGRFDKLIYVAPPDLAGREEILRVRARKTDPAHLAEDVDFPELAKQTEGYSGAEVVSLWNTAITDVAKKCIKSQDFTLQLHMEDLESAMKGLKMQITPEMVQEYERWASGEWEDVEDAA